MNTTLPETSSPVSAPPTAISGGRPHALLYATSAGLGGSGLNSTSLEGVLASWRGGFLQRAICYPVRQSEIGRRRIRSLQHHPVRLLSGLGSEDYYAAKKRYLDWITARELRSGRYDFFHGWSSECFLSLIEARTQGVPSVFDVPTWHRNKGVAKPGETKSEREIRLADRGWKDWRKHLQVTRQQQLAEYDLADVLLMPSHKATETFLSAGIPAHKLHYVGRGVDVQRYQPGTPPEIFRVGFVGALIKRKGVHLLLQAWKKLNLKNAELLLIGSLHAEMKPYLAECATDSVKVVGFTNSVQDELRRCAAFAFPSECEGFAKATLEAAACGLPLIGTRESGDIIVDGETGMVIPPNDLDMLCATLESASQRRDDLAAMGQRARHTVEQSYTWDHYRTRVLNGYQLAMQRAGSR